eukprot:scaffold103569_cov35-Tisochrysis_lutea.AAC.1
MAGAKYIFQHSTEDMDGAAATEVELKGASKQLDSFGMCFCAAAPHYQAPDLPSKPTTHSNASTYSKNNQS